MQLHDYISQLLNHHNCVIVPDFGGFIANYESANVNRTSFIIHPPRKQVLFNKNLTRNDGLLANAIMLKESLDYSESLVRIQENVQAWQKKLVAGERIEIGEIGFLFAQNNQIIFEQNRETNLLLQAYGFSQITFVDFTALHDKIVATTFPVKEEKEKITVAKPIVEKVTPIIKLQPEKKKETLIALDKNATIEPVSANDTEETKIISLPEENKKNNRYKYIAAAIVLPALFYSYWIPMKTDFLDTGKIQVTDFNPLRSQANKIYEKRISPFTYQQDSTWKSWEELTASLPKELGVYNYALNDETYIPVKLNNEDTKRFNANAPFHLIGGCFSVEKNAVKLIQDLQSKGYNAGIVDKENGLHRVSVSAYTSENDANQGLENYKKQGFSGWILKR